MKTSLKPQKSNKMSVIRIAPVCNGKIYITPDMDLPIEESVEHVSTKSDKEARKVKEKYHPHLRTDASPRFCVMHRSASDHGATVYLYVLPLKHEDEIDFREGTFVTSEDIQNHPEAYAPDLQTESELLGMAAELWQDFYA